ncbi:phospho-sugar mutase [Mediannikoviicoccus vaginalis]|uniref:phospho-sugar mutase n=1 Tax=Mediannikoviicoccus vaginalis TaxID=2899727 RepID=UPI001F3E0A52|nr:phospho-sugar mutase [Mediannikoviicoccus vaginalis]
MNYKEIYRQWLNGNEFDDETKKELAAIASDEEEIKDRFYQSLQFGTAGLRGKIGAGTNRMNEYMVAKATQGFATTIIEKGDDIKGEGVAISYDVRHFSKEFARITAEVFAGNGIKVYLSDDIRPTPLLSYAVRNFKCAGGVMVTASHNPKEYNGYKAYGPEGSQILEDMASSIEENIGKIESFSEVKRLPLEEGIEKGLIEMYSTELDKKYLKDVLSLTINEDIDKDIKIVYTPLNGTGNKYVREVLKRRGFNNIVVVEEQENPDPDFTTVGYPNPEDPKAFKYAIDLGKKVSAEMLIGTDPDADRAAIEVRDKEGNYVFLNGNKIGALMIHYILSQRYEKKDLPSNSVIVKSIVTGDLGKAIANKYSVETIETLTGFKNICAVANESEITGEKEFIYGFEESIGYNYGTFVRDKDAVSSAMVICEMAAYYKKQGKSLLDVLEELKDEYGFYDERLISIVLEGLEGQEKIGQIMKEFRENPLTEIKGMKLEKTIDYLNDDTGIPKSNVLKYYFDDGSWYALRPSGTEPKIKIYIYSKGESEKDSKKKLDLIEKSTKEKIDRV